MPAHNAIQYSGKQRRVQEHKKLHNAATIFFLGIIFFTYLGKTTPYRIEDLNAKHGKTTKDFDYIKTFHEQCKYMTMNYSTNATKKRRMRMYASGLGGARDHLREMKKMRMQMDEDEDENANKSRCERNESIGWRIIYITTMGSWWMTPMLMIISVGMCAMVYACMKMNQ